MLRRVCAEFDIFQRIQAYLFVVPNNLRIGRMTQSRSFAQGLQKSFMSISSARLKARAKQWLIR
jgi:hypothetical protein